jgi:hypothetical protein
LQLLEVDIYTHLEVLLHGVLQADYWEKELDLACPSV